MHSPPQDTPLHHACFGGHDLTIRALLDAGANPRALTADGVLPMDLCARVRFDMHRRVSWTSAQGSPACFLLSQCCQ